MVFQIGRTEKVQCLSYNSLSKTTITQVHNKWLIWIQKCGYLIIQTYHYPTQDMISIIAEKGKSFDQLFRTTSKNSHCSLRDKLDTEQPINWNEECVLVVASVLKVGKGFTSPTVSMTLEIHTCFLS